MLGQPERVVEHAERARARLAQRPQHEPRLDRPVPLVALEPHRDVARLAGACLQRARRSS